jgi:5-methylcytosine-specific restriction endonuclease McrA
MSRRNDLDAKTILILLGVAFIYGLVKGIITLFEMIGQGFVKLGKGICNFFSNISYSINNYINTNFISFIVIIVSISIFIIGGIILLKNFKKRKIEKKEAEQRAVEIAKRIAEEQWHAKMEKKRAEIEKKRKEAQRRAEEEKRLAEEEFQRKISIVRISDDRNDYIISKEDYKRGNPVDNDYRKTWFLTLLKIYDNKCANCGDSSNGCDLDHFVFAKNEGGNFIMKHRDGYFVNNAIPLCQNCNRSKGDQDYNNFFSEEKLLELFTKNAEMTKLINERKTSNVNY